MGNCLVQESSMHWGGDDWGTPEADHQPLFSTKHHRSNNDAAAQVHGHHEDKNVTDFGVPAPATSSRTTATEVKIKVTRVELEAFLGKVDLKQMSVEQVLEQLMIISSGEREVHDQDSWRPALHSIPE